MDRLPRQSYSFACVFGSHGIHVSDLTTFGIARKLTFISDGIDKISLQDNRCLTRLHHNKAARFAHGSANAFIIGNVGGIDSVWSAYSGRGVGR